MPERPHQHGVVPGRSTRSNAESLTWHRGVMVRAVEAELVAHSPAKSLNQSAHLGFLGSNTCASVLTYARCCLFGLTSPLDPSKGDDGAERRTEHSDVIASFANQLQAFHVKAAEGASPLTGAPGADGAHRERPPGITD